MMEFDFDDSVARGLHRYVRRVARTLGIRGECWCVDGEEPFSAYIALDGRLRRFADRDVALLWDENQGWSVAIETHSGEDLLVVTHFGHDLLPTPETLAVWVQSHFNPASPTGQRAHAGEHPSRAGAAQVRRRLATYARPSFTTTPSRAH